MKLVLKCALLALLFLVVSCSSDSSSSSGSCQSDIAFLQTGKTLNYAIEQFGFPSGSMNLAFGSCDGNGLFSVNRTFLDNNGVQTSSQIDKIKIDGDYMKIDVANSETFYERLFKKNAQLHDMWQDQKADGTIYYREVTDIDSLITVPAGSFHCIVYKQTTSNTINENYLFWNDQIGEIFEESGFITLKLLSHN